MDRRRFLAALAAGATAGCAGMAGGGDDPTKTGGPAGAPAETRTGSPTEYDYQTTALESPLRVTDFGVSTGPVTARETTTASSAVAFDASVTDDTARVDDPAELTFSLTNAGEEEWQVTSGPVAPFGVLFAEGDGDEQFLLWRGYDEADCVYVDRGPPDRVVVCDALHWTPIAPGETLARGYEIRGDVPITNALGPGEWRVEGTVDASRSRDGPERQFDWTVRFALERA